ncbi:MAG: response regulator transcription factor [Anaerolineae bacterium]
MQGQTGPAVQGPRILIVDDDPDLVRLLTLWLEHSGYRTETAPNGLEALGHLTRSTFDLVVLDVEMPHLDGFEACRRIRQQSSVPILMLTVLGAPEQRMDGLSLGADDYLPKPFSVQEFMLRVQALLRRARGAPLVEERGYFSDGYLLVDVAQHRVLRAGVPVHLTQTEFAILALLVRHRGQVLSTERILREVWGEEVSLTGARSVRVYIRYLRQKIEPEPSRPRYIHTERHLGYTFNPREA